MFSLGAHLPPLPLIGEGTHTQRHYVTPCRARFESNARLGVHHLDGWGTLKHQDTAAWLISLFGGGGTLHLVRLFGRLWWPFLLGSFPLRHGRICKPTITSTRVLLCAELCLLFLESALFTAAQLLTLPTPHSFEVSPENASN